MNTSVSGLRVEGGCCAVCQTNKPNGPGSHFMVDHDHSTGRIRGLVCCNCNFLIGHSKDNPETLRKAIAYLERQVPIVR